MLTPTHWIWATAGLLEICTGLGAGPWGNVGENVEPANTPNSTQFAHRQFTIFLFPLPLAFHNRDVAIHRHTRETLNGAAGLRPFDFQPVDLGSLTDAENKPWIVRREIASSAHLHAAALEISSLVSDASANGIRVSFLCNQVQAEPVILSAHFVAEENGSTIVDRNQHVQGSVVIEITYGETTR